MGSLQTVMSPQLLAAEAFLVMKPQRIRWKGWPEFGDCVRHFGNTVDCRLTDLSVALPEIHYSWGKHETGIPICGLRRVDPKVSLAASAPQFMPHGVGTEPARQRGASRDRRLPRELAFTRPHRRTSRCPRHQEVNLRRASTQHWENDQGHELALSPGSFWREGGRPSTSIDSGDN